MARLCRTRGLLPSRLPRSIFFTMLQNSPTSPARANALCCTARSLIVSPNQRSESCTHSMDRRPTSLISFCCNFLSSILQEPPSTFQGPILVTINACHKLGFGSSIMIRKHPTHCRGPCDDTSLLYATHRHVHVLRLHDDCYTLRVQLSF